MEWENIKTLLERFYAGETSREEEVYLRKYFSQPDVPKELSAEKQQFMLLTQWQSESPLNEEFDAQIMQKISATTKQQSRSVGWYTLTGIAASILLAMALWFGNVGNKKPVLPGTTDNQALAYAQTRTALQMVSENLNAGLRPTGIASRNFIAPLEKAGEIKILNSSIKPLTNLDEIERARRLMASINSVYINFEPVKK